MKKEKLLIIALYLGICVAVFFHGKNYGELSMVKKLEATTIIKSKAVLYAFQLDSISRVNEAKNYALDARVSFLTDTLTKLTGKSSQLTNEALITLDSNFVRDDEAQSISDSLKKLRL